MNKSIFSICTIPLATLLLACSSSVPPAASASSSISAGAACSSLQGAQETLEHFYKPGTIVHAQPIKKRVFKARALQPEHTFGATLRIKAQPGMSAPYLHRVLACHADTGEQRATNDPLHPSSGAIVDLTVRQRDGNFMIDLVAPSSKVGEEVWKRAEEAAKNKSRLGSTTQTGATSSHS